MIKIFYDEVDFRLKGKRRSVNLINEIIQYHKKQTGDLNIIFTDDTSLRSINVSFLNHDYNTDVITFDYSTVDIVNGEIYISVDTVKENSRNYNVSFQNEIERVIIHGILHLMGFQDKTEEERRRMRQNEDKWLLRLKEIQNGI